MSTKTVLIVEDNELNMKLAVAILEPEGYRLLEAADAETGLEMVREHRPDLILMDVQLPGMDGLTAISILKKNPELKEIPVLVLTSYAMDEDAKRARDAGADGYVTKPFVIQAFRETVRSLLVAGTAAGFATAPVRIC